MTMVTDLVIDPEGRSRMVQFHREVTRMLGELQDTVGGYIEAVGLNRERNSHEPPDPSTGRPGVRRG